MFNYKINLANKLISATKDFHWVHEDIVFIKYHIILSKIARDRNKFDEILN